MVPLSWRVGSSIYNAALLLDFKVSSGLEPKKDALTPAIFVDCGTDCCVGGLAWITPIGVESMVPILSLFSLGDGDAHRVA